MLIPTFELTGEKAVNRAFRKLGPKLGKKPIRKGARAGAKIQAAAIKKKTPRGRRKQGRDARGRFVSTGPRLRDQVKVRSISQKRGQILVGATLGSAKGLNQGEGFYGAFVNFGRGPAGWHKGRTKGSGFIEKAFEASKKRAERKAAEVIADETNEELRKL